jgi:hypothetical protein
MFRYIRSLFYMSRGIDRDLEAYKAQVQLLVQKYEKEARAAQIAYVELERRTDKRLQILEKVILGSELGGVYAYARAGVERLKSQNVPEVFYKGYQHPSGTKKR